MGTAIAIVIGYMAVTEVVKLWFYGRKLSGNAHTCST
jgi:hypothetical protein